MLAGTIPHTSSSIGFHAHQERKVDLLRTCFDTDHNYEDPEDETRALDMADLVRSDMERQFHILRGQDKFGQSIMIKYPRTKGGTTESSYVMAQIYVAERSTAATEYLTRGQRERSIAVYNYLGFDRSTSPGFTMQVAAATQVQQLYPERLQTLVFVEPPFWLQGILSMLKPFLSETVTERIQWATGQEQRSSIFLNVLGPDKEKSAIPLLHEDGKLTSAVSLDHFLIDTPFFGSYDSVPCSRQPTAEEVELNQISCTPGPDAGKNDLESTLSDKASALWGSFSNGFGALSSNK